MAAVLVAEVFAAFATVAGAVEVVAAAVLL